MFKISSAPS